MWNLCLIYHHRNTGDNNTGVEDHAACTYTNLCNNQDDQAINLPKKDGNNFVTISGQGMYWEHITPRWHDSHHQRNPKTVLEHIRANSLISASKKPQINHTVPICFKIRASVRLDVDQVRNNIFGKVTVQNFLHDSNAAADGAFVIKNESVSNFEDGQPRQENRKVDYYDSRD